MKTLGEYRYRRRDARTGTLQWLEVWQKNSRGDQEAIAVRRGPRKESVSRRSVAVLLIDSMRFKLRMSCWLEMCRSLSPWQELWGGVIGMNAWSAWGQERLGEELETTRKAGSLRSFAVRGAETWGNSWEELRGQGKVLFFMMREITCLLMEWSVFREGRTEDVLVTSGSPSMALYAGSTALSWIHFQVSWAM